ncbi:DUF202 domain-containing protein [Ancylomarina sp.]|uniref:DUF202 domain-containing protein n=1 Tax=Ancylomarina sp. TaxID=1970196 RepID=UPI0035678015
MEQNEIKLTDMLALERTNLANERTFLSYFRTSIVFLSSGFVILKIEDLQNLKTLAYILLIAAFFLLIVGIVRFIHVRKRINNYYTN